LNAYQTFIYGLRLGGVCRMGLVSGAIVRGPWPIPWPGRVQLVCIPAARMQCINLWHADAEQAIKRTGRRSPGLWKDIRGDWLACFG